METGTERLPLKKVGEGHLLRVLHQKEQTEENLLGVSPLEDMTVATGLVLPKILPLKPQTRKEDCPLKGTHLRLNCPQEVILLR